MKIGLTIELFDYRGAYVSKYTAHSLCVATLHCLLGRPSGSYILYATVRFSKPRITQLNSAIVEHGNHFALQITKRIETKRNSMKLLILFIVFIFF